MTLTYTEPPGCPKLKAGAIVAVCDRTGLVMSYERFKRSGHKWMVLEGGRRFRNGTGWFIGSAQDWPFPYIRRLSMRENKIKDDAMKEKP